MLIQDIIEQVQFMMESLYKGVKLTTEQYTKLADELANELLHWHFTVSTSSK